MWCYICICLSISSYFKRITKTQIIILSTNDLLLVLDKSIISQSKLTKKIIDLAPSFKHIHKYT